MTIKIDGLKELQKNLKILPANIQRNVIRSANLAGANVIKKEAINNVPVRDDGKVKQVSTSKSKGFRYPGYLKKNIGVIRNKKTPRHTFSHLVKTLRFAFYGAFLEFGTSRQSAKPWLRPAFEAKKNEALQKIKERMEKGIDREVGKLRK